MKTILVGEAPPKSRMVDTPESVAFSGASGKRFSDMLGVDVTEAFATMNLLKRWPGTTGKGSSFPLGRARQSATMLVNRLPPSNRLILAGGRVANAFRIAHLPQLEWHTTMLGPPVTLTTFKVAVIPHPSGVNRAWNDPAITEAVKRFLVAEYERTQHGTASRHN